MKFGSPTPSRVLKDHLRRTCLLNSVITDHCFYRFVYIALVLIFSFFFYHYEYGLIAALVLIFSFFTHCKYNTGLLIGCGKKWEILRQERSIMRQIMRFFLKLI